MNEAPSNVELMRRSFDAWNRNDWDALEEYYDPEVVGKPPEEWPESRDIEGWEAVRDQFARNKDSWEEERVEIDEIEALDSEKVMAQIRWVTMGKESRISFESRVTVLTAWREGRIVRIEYYLDHADALEAAGLREDGA